MKLELKTLLPYIVLVGTLAMTWGMWSEKIQAVEAKADSVSEMQKILLSSNFKSKPFKKIFKRLKIS